MIEVEILRNKSGRAVGIRSLGHADYADSGYDIICAAVSVLELNFANSVAELTDAKFETHFGEEEGSFDFVLLGKRNENAELLLKSLLLGYAAIRQEYGSEYLLIKDQEV